MSEIPDLELLTLHETPYGWPLHCLNIPGAHEVTKGSEDLIVAVVDLGYTYHPQHEGHLWVNPDPRAEGKSGWDCHDDDASLEYNLHNPDTDYHKGHHSFITGEIIMCVPDCRVMNIRVGYGNPDSWWKGFDFAVRNGARILVVPHGFLSHGPDSGSEPLFYQGTDFAYPYDNPGIRRSLDDAYDAGCFICKGVAGNRGRRVATINAGLDSVFSVGSSNRHNQAADIACSADYTEAATPGGERSSEDKVNEHIWSTGGREDFMPFTGGCMASGFAGGVAALVWSRFPELKNDQVRQILRNTARLESWDSRLGYGVLNAERAVSLKPTDLAQRPVVASKQATPESGPGSGILPVVIRNEGTFDVEHCLVVAFNGDPRKPAVPEATKENPVILVTRQIGHAIVPVRGLHEATARIELTENPGDEVWIEVASLDRHGSPEADVRAVAINRRGA